MLAEQLVPDSMLPLCQQTDLNVELRRMGLELRGVTSDFTRRRTYLGR